LINRAKKVGKLTRKI